jgi:hypothetical protein
MGSEQRKLTIELVPTSCWYSNMRTLVPRKVWDSIRKETYTHYNHACGICGSTQGRLNCHEIWVYDDDQHMQSLDGFIALCDLCHHCKHLGFAGILASRGQLDMQVVIDHYCKVNGCSLTDFKEDERSAFELWSYRSEFPWDTDLGEYALYLTTPHP